MWDRFDSIERELGERFHDIRERLEETLKDKLTQPQGWSLESVRDGIQEDFPNLSEGQAETVARSETASVLNTAREEGYEEQPDSATFKYKWVGPDDSRTTVACELLKEWTNPDYGGTPRAMNELKRLERKAQKEDEDLSGLDYREHMLHPNERHTFRRVLPHELQRLEGASKSASSSGGHSGTCVVVEDYEDIVRKMATVVEKRTTREAEIEEAIGVGVPNLLNDLLGKHGGSKRPALRDLNERLDDADVETNVSPNTFYKWAEKYGLDDRDYSNYQ